MENKLNIFILDDNIPKTPENVEKSVYDKKIDSQTLLQLAKEVKWVGNYNLQQITRYLFESVHFVNGSLNVYGFIHPLICLNEIESGFNPDILIYDWEYGTESNLDRSKWLIEILKSTNAFIFVYSAFRDEIPPYLNKKEFDEHSSRFQLFLKGDIESYIYSSEEFIFQYIVSRLSKSNKLKIHGVEVSFTENGYLKNPSDILHLEKILGRTLLIKKLEESKYTISTASIEKILEDIKENILFDSKRNLLITSDSTLLIQKFKPEIQLSFSVALKKFGLDKMKEVLEVGIAKV